MSQLIIIENVFEPDTAEVIDFVGPITPVLEGRYAEFPKHGHLFFHSIAEENRILVETPEQVDKLNRMEGTFYLVNAPGWTAVFIFIVIVAAVLLRPKIPNIAQRNVQQSSPNNQLSQRTNSPRTGARVPDIYGRLRATLDMLAVPYNIYIDNLEHEVAFLCIGRGQYEIYDVRDDTTPLQQISGSYLEAYNPGEKVADDAGATNPFYTVGGRIPLHFPLMFPQKSNSVNGQTLRAPNGNNATGKMVALSDGTITMVFSEHDPHNFDFTKLFSVGDIVILEMDPVLYPATSKVCNVTPKAGGILEFAAATVPDNLTAGAIVEIQGGTFTMFRQTQTGWVNNPNAGQPGEPDQLPVYTTIMDRVVNLTGAYTVAAVNVIAGGVVQAALSNPAAVAPDWTFVTAASTFDAIPRMIVTTPAGTMYNLNGEYEIQSFPQTTIVKFRDPLSVSPDWDKAASTIQTGIHNLIRGSISKKGEDPKIGPYIVNMEGGQLLLCNFIAPNGIYKDNGETQFAARVEIRIEYTQVDEDGNAIGPVNVRDIALDGSSTNRETVGKSEFIVLDPPGRYAVSAVRTSDTDLRFDGQVVDDVKWSELYHMRKPEDPELIYKDVTAVRLVQAATMGALAVKDRKLNMLVCRMVPVWDLGTNTQSAHLHATTQMDHILAAVAVDPYIGNLSLDNLDSHQMAETINSVRDYFNVDGDPQSVTEFAYTFDKENTTVEETLQMIANACFMVAYRSGDKIRLSFLKKDRNATMLFNHRNKLPNSETRNFRFGTENGQEGVQYVWVNPKDDALEDLVYPAGAPPWNLKKVESVGVRNYYQAHLHAAREWALMKYQYLQTEFDAISHGELLAYNDLILVSDNTSFRTYDGEVTTVNGTTITTSQPLDELLGQQVTVFLQLPDKTVQSISGTVTGSNRVSLQQAPNVPLVTELDAYSRTGYHIIPPQTSPDEPTLFLVNEAVPGDTNSVKVKAQVYNDNLFEGDGMFRP